MSSLFFGIFLACAALTYSKPIMVSFGTNQGPIIPPQKITQSPKIIRTRSPAPVTENTDDLPNPNAYRPLIPHQYRSKILAAKPNPNLILGTPLDVKYTPSIQKYNLIKKQARTVGFDYTGPQVFEKQEYERIEELRKRNEYLGYVQDYNPQRRTEPTYQYQYQAKSVPQIGVVYTSGLRYYVPQIVYYGQGEDENSVYDHHDVKRVY